MTIRIRISLFVGLFAWVACASSASSGDLEERIGQLEDEVQVAQEERSDLSSGFSNLLKVAGYTDVEYGNSTRKGDNPGFRLHHLSLFFKKQFGERWNFFSEIEYEDAPFIESGGDVQSVVTPGPDGKAGTADDGLAKVNTFDGANGKIFVEAVNIDYHLHPAANFRVGRFFTPAGIWSIDHYPPFVPTQERPQHIRKIFPQVVDGADFFGNVSLGRSIFFDYDLYTGNGEGNTGHKDENSSKVLGIKGNFSLPVANLWEVGGTYYRDNEDTQFSDNKLTAYGVHTKFEWRWFTLQSEFADGKLEPAAAASFHKRGWYAQLLYGIDRWTLGYRYDFFDKQSMANVDQVINSLIVNYHFSNDIVTKVEYHNIDPDAPGEDSYRQIIASVALNLGN